MTPEQWWTSVKGHSITTAEQLTGYTIFFFSSQLFTAYTFKGAGVCLCFGTAEKAFRVNN